MLQRTLRVCAVLACLIVLGAIPAQAADEGSMRTALDRFTGEWIGEVEVRALDGFVLKTLSATRRYTWRGNEQMVETVLTDTAGDYVVRSRQFVRLGRLEAVISRPSLPDDRYFGETEIDAVTWTNAEGNRRDTRDQLVVRDGVSVLQAASLEPIRSLGLSGLVRIVGDFRRSGDVVAQEPRSQPAVAEGDEETLLPLLEAERAASAALAQRLDEAQRRATVAEARIQELEPELEGARAKIASAATTEVDLGEKLARLGDERDLIQRRLDEVEKGVAALARDSGDVSAARQGLEARVAELAGSISTLERERDAWRTRSEEVERRAGTSEAERSAAQEALALAQAESRRLVGEVAGLRQEVAQSGAQRETLAAELATARTALASGTTDAEALRSVRAQLVTLEATVAEMRSSAAESEREAAALRTKLGSAAGERDAAMARIATLERAQETLVADLDRARSQTGSTVTEAHQARDQAEERARLRAAELEELKVQLARAVETTRQITEERDQRAQDVRQLQLDNETLARSLEAAKTGAGALAAEVTTLKASVSALEQTGRATKIELDESRRHLAEVDAQRLASNRELAELKSQPVPDTGALAREREDLQARVALLQSEAEQRQRDNERLLVSSQRTEQERVVLERRVAELEARLVAAAPASTPAPAPESGPSIAATVRDQLIAEVQQMERRVLELESERNAAREQVVHLQRQGEEVRRLRDETLERFQTVVTELNAMREEKERLSRANVSLQAEVRDAQQRSRASANQTGSSTPAPAAASATTTADGRTADMVVAALQVIGVTRGEGEDKAILDGRLYRNGDTVEPELGITFERIEGNALIFHDRRGREYRRRF